MDFSQLAPAPRAEALPAAPSVEMVADPTPVASAAAPAPPAVAPPRFVAGRRPLSRTVDLDYPLEFDGRVYERVVVRRPSSKEVGEFFERFVVEAGSGRTLPFPIFVDEAGEPVPAEVIQALDGVDEERVDDAAMDFLPPRLQRFRAALQSASLPPAGDNTAPTSST